MANYMVFGGLVGDSEEPEIDSGIGLFGSYNNVDDLYYTTPEHNFVIDTPNYSSNNSIGGNQAIDSELCGSMPENVGSTYNTQHLGFAMNVGGDTESGPVTFPVAAANIWLGAVWLEEYADQDGNFSSTDWANNFGDVGAQFDLVNGSKKPGRPAQDPDWYNFYTVSKTPMIAAGKNGSRMHWDVQIGTLGAFSLKMRNIIGRQGITQFGLPTTSTSDELAAGCWLACGHGILLDGELAFATKQP